MEITCRNGGKIRLGYRSPQLTRELDPAGKMALARELGMTVIEPQINKLELGSPDDAAALRSAADAAGVDLPGCGGDLPLWEDAAAIAAKLAENLAIVAALRGRHLFTRVLMPPVDWPQRRAWEHLAEVLPPCADTCGAAGVALLVEADHGAFIQNLERFERLLDLVDHPYLRANFDACNLYCGGSDPLLAVERLGSRIVSGHVKDGVYRKDDKGEKPVGEGELDWAAIFAAMAAADVAVPMFIEHCKAADQVRAAAVHLAGCI